MIDEKEKARFVSVCEKIIAEGHAEMGIGTYGEKYMHLILKHFFCEDTDWHEVGQGSFVADAMVGDTVYEIQTGGYYPLKKKLAYYLSSTHRKVVIVSPVVLKKRLFWVDPETGAAEKPRATTVRMAWTRVLREMYWLCELLDFDRVSFRLPVLAVDEYRRLDGFGKDKKKKATKIEKIPRELLDMKEIVRREDVMDVLVPEGLPERFFAKDFSRLTGARRLALSACLRVLESLDIIERDGKEGNAVVYRRKM